MNEVEESKNIASDLARIMRGETPADEAQLREWMEGNSGSKEVMEHLMDADYLSEKLNLLNSSDKERQANTLKKLLDGRRKNQFVKKLVYSLSAAVVLISLSVVYLLKDDETERERVVTSTMFSDETIVTPTVILSSGEKINPKSERYEVCNASVGEKQENLPLNRFVVPSKFIRKIKLSDGTVVTLNSNSELSYPTEFIGTQRVVKLKGEAFFEVTHSSIPFVVEASQARIKVYGTKFNVENYNGKIISAVLVEGSVGVSLKNNNEVLLKPNDLITIQENGGGTKVEQVNPEKYLAWMTGYTKYERDQFRSMIEDISRWYGVEFIYNEEDFINETITGAFDRTSSLEEILQTIETTLNIRFTKEKGRYIIEKNN